MERVVLVSGGGRGLGAAITERLLADGWTVSLGLRDIARADRFGPPDRVQAVTFDANEPTAATAWVGAAAERFGRIDALVNNAGIMHMTSMPCGRSTSRPPSV